MTSMFIKNLIEKLKLDLPGPRAHKKMFIKTKINRIDDYSKNKIRAAAVLILLYPYKKDWYFFLTRRSNSVGHHKGQISLPGGVVEKNESYQYTSIRETHEEIGISMNEINIIGNLSSLHVPVSNFQIFPFIGYLDRKPDTTLNLNEVKEIFSVPINQLISDKSLKTQEKLFSNEFLTVPYFSLCNEMVWGATSAILSEFKSTIKDIY